MIHEPPIACGCQRTRTNTLRSSAKRLAARWRDSSSGARRTAEGFTAESTSGHAHRRAAASPVPAGQRGADRSDRASAMSCTGWGGGASEQSNAGRLTRKTAPPWGRLAADS